MSGHAGSGKPMSDAEYEAAQKRARESIGKPPQKASFSLSRAKAPVARSDPVMPTETRRERAVRITGVVPASEQRSREHVRTASELEEDVKKIWANQARLVPWMTPADIAAARARPSRPLRLGELDAEEREEQERLFGKEFDLEIVTCKNCEKDGHMTDDCPDSMHCLSCGHLGIKHDEGVCPVQSKPNCEKCGRSEHQDPKDCRMMQPCEWCEELGHSAEFCTNSGRRPPQKSEADGLAPLDFLELCLEAWSDA